MQQEQSRIAPCNSASADPISRASPAGRLRMFRARRVAVLVPMPGSWEKLRISRSSAGGMMWRLLIDRA